MPFELVNWYGLFAPGGTPPGVVALLHQNAVQALATPEIEIMLAKDGAEAAPSKSPADFSAVLAKEVERWNKIVLLPGFADALR